MSTDEYRKSKGINPSVLSSGDTLMHIRYAKDHPKEATPDMNLGSALHLALFLPSDYEKNVFVFEGDLKSDKQRVAYEDAKCRYRVVIRESQKEDLDGMLAALRANADVKEILEQPAKVELPCFSDKTGVQKKGQLDRFGMFRNYPTIFDLKKCADASPKGFQRQVVDLLYHMKAAFYLDLLSEIAEADRRFVWICVESKAPYPVALYEASDDLIQMGRAKYKRIMESYLKAKEENWWPAWHSGIEVIENPIWNKG